jgi:hypothetical protein
MVTTWSPPSRIVACVLAFSCVLQANARGQSAPLIERHPQGRIGFSTPSPKPEHETPTVLPLPFTKWTGVRRQPDEDSDPGPYVVVGGLIGGLALGGAVAVSAARCNDCGGVGAIGYIAVSIGALVGGFVGWVVYKATR